MNPLRWSSCLWLWFMCTGVECLPKFNLSARHEDDDSVTLTINYIVDNTHITDKKVQIEGFLQWVTHQAMYGFQHFFGFTLNLQYTTIYLENKTDLKLMLKPNERENYIWPDGAISTLSGYYRGQSNFDIICLVTKLRLDDGSTVRNGYGYHGERDSLCGKLADTASLRSKSTGIPILHAALYYPGQHKPRYWRTGVSRSIKSA
uniref:Putative secreted protein n=1 Tax=Ixodes ricinus TaxID=34613 RepID=V5H274_IXORI